MQPLKKLLIIYPHFPPSNLAGIHRVRLIAPYLKDYGWDPIVLTVHEDYYEEDLDQELLQLVPSSLRVEKVSANKINRFRMPGDIGLRAFNQLHKKALQIIITEHIDFVWIPVPSYYTALLGTKIFKATGTPFGIDYIDPWVHKFPGSEKLLSRHWMSSKLASLLERKALKNVSLITGVAQRYIDEVLDRNRLRNKIIYGAMPYGADANDFRHIAENYLGFKGLVHFLYAGALLPKAVDVLSFTFEVLARNGELQRKFHFHFIGTGKRRHEEYSEIKMMADKFGLWPDVISESGRRHSYTDVLRKLRQTDAVFVLGSTEAHYTPSKIYQSLQSGRPVFAMLHESSASVAILENSGHGRVFTFNEVNVKDRIENDLAAAFNEFYDFVESFSPAPLDAYLFPYSAQKSAAYLAELLDKALPKL